jgi:hypothetical protein
MEDSPGRTTHRMRARPGLLALALVPIAILLASVAVASAADPTAAQYHSGTQQVSAFGGEHVSGAGGGGASGLSSQIGGLPFTGMDVIVLVLAAVALVGGGLVLRRVAASSDQT